MATRKPAPLDGGLIARKGQAAPAAVPTATATKDTIAVTVRLDPELYLALKGRSEPSCPMAIHIVKEFHGVGDQRFGLF
jgi:hypothetical protein